MNKCYRLIWNEVNKTWAVVSELVKTRGKRASCVVGGKDIQSAGGGAAKSVNLLSSKFPPGCRPTLLALALASIGTVYAAPAPTQLPTGGQVVAGAASIAQSAASLNINQSSNRAAIDWQTFNRTLTPKTVILFISNPI